MGRGILIRIAGKLIFHDKIQQSDINITRLHTSGGRSNRRTNKIIVISIGKITKLGVLLSHHDYANKISRKEEIREKKANEKEGE